MNTKAERELADMYEAHDVYSVAYIADYFGITVAQVHMVYKRYTAQREAR